MRSILIASFLSLAITFGGYIGVVKLTAQRGSKAKADGAELTKEDVAAAKLQLEGAEEKAALLVGLQGTLAATRTNLDMARDVLVEEQQKLEQLHQKLAADVAAAEELNEESMRKLAKLYESMKPTDAARIASQLDNQLVVEIIPRMKERSAAKMLSAMDREKAVEITRLIAERKKQSGGS